MSYCDRCGFRLPDGAGYCPSCGSPVRKKVEAPVPSAAPIARILQAGVLGAFLSITISTFSPQGVDLYFIPSFLSSLVAIYLSRTRKLDEAITIALTVYLFADAIVAGMALGTLYSQRIPLAEFYGDYVPSLVDVIMYTANPITAIISGYIGNRLISRREVKQVPPVTYRREEEPGGIIYSLKTKPERTLAYSSHNV